MFVHTPETGGTSARQAYQIERAELFDPRPECMGMPSLAFVRNPYDRIESLWRDWRFLHTAGQTRPDGISAFPDHAQSYIRNTGYAGASRRRPGPWAEAAQLTGPLRKHTGGL